MIIKHIKYFPFSINLKTPFHNSSNRLTARNGFIISLTDERGNTAFGECSPLPGFSKESIDETEIVIKTLQEQLTGSVVTEDIIATDEFLLRFNFFPSIRFAFDHALFNLMAVRSKVFMSSQSEKFNTVVNVNAVLGLGDINNILAGISEKIDNGFKTFKIKIGREKFEDDLKLIDAVRKKFGSSIFIRLDVNGKWEFEAAIKHLDSLKNFGIQYIEEPCKGIRDLCLLDETSPIPIAIDESISSVLEITELIQRSSIRFLIIKPSLLGGLFKIIELIKMAENYGKKLIISSAFESSVGKSALVMLAALTNHSFAHGLDTIDFFEKDLCTDPYKINNGSISFSYADYPPEFDIQLI